MTRTVPVALLLACVACGGSPFALERAPDTGAPEGGPDAVSEAADDAGQDAGTDAPEPREASDGDAAHDASDGEVPCRCVDVPAGWTLAEGSFARAPCDGSYQGGTTSYWEISGTEVFACLPSVAPTACGAGVCSSPVSAADTLCVTQPGTSACPAGLFAHQHVVWTAPQPPSTSATMCCLQP